MAGDDRRRAGNQHRRRVLRSVPSDLPDAHSTVHIGHRLRDCRERQGLTQENAAGAAGLTRNALASLEGKQFPNPHLQTLLALMQVYKLSSLEELLGPLPSYRVANSWEAAGWTGTRRQSS